ncbi:MAG: thiamine-phosphate pyrophosphorylase [Candidatus Omnitrophica bacterium]|nr:thiamine-phosphate pyrophosphorylase [Candidatus Omnitrophota bacterium]MBU2044468.1 thiamine-phosphate pyrophosphorylase [Candidatus Omnitrophota bacterium]MBU2250913.1 thiamine-phosphate pyrophosphorylase [Candidatus Omnitrophota bacterium]MBU2265943.1 thiamine-phosphate pyrophosphorylase [Candidatus Omnitrophota bacterium]MBU2474098.1 thiamine-phosphate pyrophosphorylase [Candidatus Omnitrophota bacterium]
MLKKEILRVVDANFNRAKEGLRVVEDTFRFVFEEDSLRKTARTLRHALDSIAREEIFKDAILSRNSRKDIGKALDRLEMKREDSRQILYINFQRVKESLRVLEEFFKLLLPLKVSKVKQIRYQLYQLEQKAVKKC